MGCVAVFIDGSYLMGILRTMIGVAHRPIDFMKLSNLLADPDERLRTYYYHCAPYAGTTPSAREQQRLERIRSFYSALSHLPRFQVRLGRLAFRGHRPDGSPVLQQKRVDIMLCLDMVQLALTRQISKVILLAGDSDFMPAVEVVKQSGVLVDLWHGPRLTYHGELWMVCDERHEIDAAFLAAVQVPPEPSLPLIGCGAVEA